ncbi:MAG: hypothetical protein RSC91_12395, partial [Clostridia bacterium]
LILTLCMTTLMASGALAEAAQPAAAPANTADFEVLNPLMDLISAASMYSVNAPETVPGADGTLSVPFTDAFFKLGQTMGAALGINAEMLTSTDAQANYLKQVFAAQLPQLEPVVMTNDVNGYIGFHPVTVNNATTDGGIQIVGEMYLGAKNLAEMSETEIGQTQWLDRGIFTFQNDPAALNGFRLTGFSIGTELSMEEALQTYFDEIVVEYVNANLGFTLLYPSIFTDEMLVEDADGVSASLPDGSMGFFAKRVSNVNGTDLKDYVGIIANGITDSVSNINEELKCGTVSYTTDDGMAVFDVYILTDKYIYQAELSYPRTKMSEYSMYSAYLENSFVVDEVSVG